MVVEETLAYYAFPEEHWRRIRTNNPRERIQPIARDAERPMSDARRTIPGSTEGE
jgi:transposase-like protein